MDRRTLLKWMGGSVVVATSAMGLAWVGLGPSARLQMDACLERLQALQGLPLASRGTWSPAAVFSHLSQSVEYSMTGFPVLKPDWFRESVGPLALGVFVRAGSMRHPLDEPIPGAPDIRHQTDTGQALMRLIGALETFGQYAGELKPHFAYGMLSKEEYARAHVLHVDNHLLLIHEQPA